MNEVTCARWPRYRSPWLTAWVRLVARVLKASIHYLGHPCRIYVTRLCYPVMVAMLTSLPAVSVDGRRGEDSRSPLAIVLNGQGLETARELLPTITINMFYLVTAIQSVCLAVHLAADAVSRDCRLGLESPRSVDLHRTKVSTVNSGSTTESTNLDKVCGLSLSRERLATMIFAFATRRSNEGDRCDRVVHCMIVCFHLRQQPSVNFSLVPNRQTWVNYNCNCNSIVINYDLVT